MNTQHLKINTTVFFLLLFFLSFFSYSVFSTNSISSGLASFLPPPPTPTLSYPGPHCKYGIATPSIIGNSTLTGVTFTYTNPGSNLNINPNSGNITLSAGTTAGVYTVNYVESGPGSCNCPATTTIQVLGSPTVTFLGLINPVCKGSSITLTASGAFSYTWTNNGLNQNPNTFSNIDKDTVIRVIGQAPNTCTSQASRTITTKTTPSVTVAQPSVCAGTPTILTAVISNSNLTGPVNYVWTPGGSNQYSLGIFPQFAPLYTVVATAGSCAKSATQSVFVIITNPRETGIFFPQEFYCANGGDPKPSLIDTARFSFGGVFSTNDPDIKVNASTGQVSFANVLPGLHTVTYSLAAAGCSVATESSAFVIVSPGGNLISTPNVSILEKTSVALNVSGGTAYNWTPSEYLSCADCENPVATPFETTIFCVTDLENGCITPACTKVEVLCFSERDFSVPNAFTPNGDKNNDLFCLQGWDYCVSDFKVMIYNRWGEKVFESTNPSFCWDGIYKDVLLNSGVYIYAITASVNRENITKKGNITLIR